MNNISGLIALVGWFCFVFTASSWMNIGFWGTILIIIISVFIIVDKDMDSIIKIFALPIGLLFAVKIAGILFTKYPYIPVLAFVAFVIYACIVGPPPPPPPPPKGTGVQRMWVGIHQDQLEALEREREELLEEIDDLRRDRDCIDTGYGIIIPNGLSDSEREYNIRRRDELDGKIRDKEWELSELENKIQSKRREVMNELDDLED